jgi:hypothetical protein
MEDPKYVSDHSGLTWQVIAHVAGGILLAIGGYFGAGLITKVQALEIQVAVTENRYENILVQLKTMDERLIRIENNQSKVASSNTGTSSNRGFPTTSRR